MRRSLRETVDRELTRFRVGGRPAVLWSLRVTIASVVSYLVATAVFPGTQPLLAPLTTMLVVQVTPVSLLASGLDRVVAVVAGVAVAVTFAAVTPLAWWSLGLLILVSIWVGQTLRLRSNLLEVAISGMLVLGVGSLGAEAAASQRIAETLVGAAAGIAVNLLFPPKVGSADAGRAIDRLADSVSDLLNGAAADLATLVAHGGDVASAAQGWLEDARRMTHEVPQAAGAALLHAEQGRRLNVRAAFAADVGPGLRQGLEALEHSAVAVRGMFGAVADAATDGSWLAEESGDDVLLGLAQTFTEMAAGVDAFGQLVRDEAGPGNRLTSGDVQTLRDALEGLREARARLDDLVLSDAPPELVQLHAAVLTAVRRLLREMDLDARIRRQVQLLRASRPRAAHGVPATRGVSVRRELVAGDETQVIRRVPRARRSRRGRS